jgi:hypothetical protein
MLSLPLSLLARMWTLLSRKTHQRRFAVATKSGHAGDVLTKEAKLEAATHHAQTSEQERSNV